MLPTFFEPESSLLMFTFELVNLAQTWKEAAGNVYFSMTQTILPPALPWSGLRSKLEKNLKFADSTMKVFYVT